jgi:tRNA-Thr(GGU) m(6)t(6)A37 methyltransferase TsaA
MNENTNKFLLEPIGIIHTPFHDPKKMPIQFSRSNEVGEIIINAPFIEGLLGIDDFSHLILLYIFHKAEQYKLLVKPFLDDQETGIFTCRHPRRPNYLGLSVVTLLKRNDNKLVIKGVDMLDGTPLVDIKPYVSDFDQQANVNIGWYSHRAHP